MCAAFRQKYQMSKKMQQIIKRSGQPRSNNNIERTMHDFETRPLNIFTSLTLKPYSHKFLMFRRKINGSIIF